jgi:hypothetical protein
MSALVAPVLLLSALATVSAAPLTIDPGPLTLTTDIGTFLQIDPVLFGGIGVPVNVNLTGNPLPLPVPLEDVALALTGTSSTPVVTHVLNSASGPNSTDTIINITSTITLPNVGDSGVIDIELVALSLQSIDPVLLDLGGGPALFDVFVDIDPLAIQVPGSMTITRDTENTGTISFLLPEDLIITLIDTSLIIPPIEQQAQLSLVGGGTFDATVTIAEPATLAVLGFGLMGLCAARRRAAAA